MTISKIKAIQHLIKYGLEKYYGEKLNALENERNSILENSQDILLDQLQHNVRNHLITPDDITITSNGMGVYMFRIPEIIERLKEIEDSITALNQEYSQMLVILENWVNYAIVHDNNVLEAPSIPEELIPFYDIATAQFREE